MKHKIGFIGLGLIGGSIAKAIRQYYPDYEIVAFDKNKESLALATQESVIDVAATTIDNNFQNCNYIFLCAPVAYNTAYLKQLTEYLNDDRSPPYALQPTTYPKLPRCYSRHVHKQRCHIRSRRAKGTDVCHATYDWCEKHRDVLSESYAHMLDVLHPTQCGRRACQTHSALPQ